VEAVKLIMNEPTQSQATIAKWMSSYLEQWEVPSRNGLPDSLKISFKIG
jgi:hypothetical protein